MNYWSRFLQSEASTYVLNDSEFGWLSDYALNEMAKETKGEKITDLFACRNTDVSDHFGFKSGDDFFTRKFKPALDQLLLQTMMVLLQMPANLRHLELLEKYQRRRNSG